jgi:hypothetical protein
LTLLTLPADQREQRAAVSAAAYQKCQDDAHKASDPISWGQVFLQYRGLILELEALTLVLGWGIGAITFAILRRIFPAAKKS